MKKLPENLNCIVTCENLEEQKELLDNFEGCSPNIDYSAIRIKDSKHSHGDRYYNAEYYMEKSQYSHYEFLTFKEFKAKYLEEFVLPEEWIIKPPQSKFKIVNDWAISKSNRDYNNYQWHSGVGYNQDGVYKPFEDATITFEQFEKYVMKKEEKEIIGYKAPMGMFNSEVKKGDLYISYSDNDDLYVPKIPLKQGSAYYSMPKELVQSTWEKVYKQQEYRGVVKGSNKSLDYVINEQGFVQCDGKKISIDTLKQFLSAKYTLLPWTVEEESWTIGCLEDVTREELSDIVTQHNKLFNL